MSLTFAQAQTALATGTYTTVASIVGLINEVSGAVVGATSQTTYLLNSGVMPDGEPSHYVITDTVARHTNLNEGDMTYILKKITPEDQQKILKDAACAHLLQKNLSFALSQNEFPETWAVDANRDTYLFLAPRFVREDSWSLPFYFYIGGRLLEIRSEGQLGNHMYFADRTEPLSLLNKILDEIKDALSVYGMWGNGPNNEKGEAEFMVNPRFVTVKGA